jgi:hypothetical protein
MPIDDYHGDAPDAAETGPGRYIKLSVPNFNLAPTTQPKAQMTSYLRLGAVEDLTTAGKKPTSLGSPNVDPTGEDLASLVTGFADDTRVRDGAGVTAANLPAAESVTPGSPTTLDDGSITMRTAESGQLHKKGGWRDHSDGNRITTTRGDKVEVIRGNYKLLVLGRRDAYDTNGLPDYSNTAGWDVSGGLVDTAPDDFANTSGEQTTLDTEYVWKIDSDGRWGWTSRTKMGSPDPKAAAGNGKTISYTWVDESWTFIGSPALDTSAPDIQITTPDQFAPGAQPRPLKKLVSKTWAETILQETHAATITTQSSPQLAPSLVSITTSGDVPSATIPSPDTSPGAMTVTSASAGKMTTTLHSEAAMDNITSSSGHMANKMSCSSDIYSEMTAKLGIEQFTGAGIAINQATITPIAITLNLSAMIMNFQLTLLLLELKTWIHLDMHLGPHMDMHLIQHFEFHAGAHLLHKTAGCFEMTESTTLSVCGGFRAAFSAAFALG